MGQVAYGRLAGAVSAAGGLGVIGAGYLTGEELRREIGIVREMTDRPFGVDILFGKVAAQDDGSLRYSAQIEDQIRVSLNERVPVLISGLGNPLGVIPEAHARGIVVMSVIGNVRQAKRVVESGVDAVIASGHEGGGHVGRVATMSLVPAVVDAVDVPVVAGGGMGTRFIATREARGHDSYKRRIVDTDEEGTVVSHGHSGKPVRMIRNRFTEYWEAHVGDIRPYPQQLIEVGESAAVRGRIEGDIDNGVLPAGQSAALVRDIRSAGDVVAAIVGEARGVLAALAAGDGSPR
jgi:enoyl-[acyl-carrier protein] reductase II